MNNQSKKASKNLAPPEKPMGLPNAGKMPAQKSADPYGERKAALNRELQKAVQAAGTPVADIRGTREGAGKLTGTPVQGAHDQNKMGTYNAEAQTDASQTPSPEAVPETTGNANPSSGATASPAQPVASSNVYETTYIDPTGSQQVGYIINGTTYADNAGSATIPVGSVVTDAQGQLWYKGENGSEKVANGAVAVQYTDPNGQQMTGFVLNGRTYSDASCTTPVPTGSVVTTADGMQWYRGEYGSYEQGGHDLSPLIEQLYGAADQQIRDSVAYETQGAVDQLNRALQDAQPSYEAAIAQQLLETKQAQDAQALRNQVNGDRGGIGSAQVDSIVNTGARNREAIAAQQRQLATDTARQIADLRAQGKYQEANLLLQNAQQRLSALYDEQVRLQGIEDARNTNLASLGSQYLSAGIMPTDEMLAAMGIDAATAQLYVDYANAGQNGNDDPDPDPDPEFEFGPGLDEQTFGYVIKAIELAHRRGDPSMVNSLLDNTSGQMSEDQWNQVKALLDELMGGG